MALSSYAIGLGSNRYRGAPPRTILERAIGTIDNGSRNVVAQASIIASPPLGPSVRRYANTAVIIETEEPPPALLVACQALEKSFGRRSNRRWGDRILDVDILLWSEGIWSCGNLVIPHPQFRNRMFVLDPLAEIVPDWSDPVTGLTVRQLRKRLLMPIPVDRRAHRP